MHLEIYHNISLLKVLSTKEIIGIMTVVVELLLCQLGIFCSNEYIDNK